MKRKRVAETIRAHESLWAKQRTIPESGHSKNAQISRMHEDPGTCLAMEQHIASAGRHANSHRLANAVTEYWSILEESGESHNAKAGRERTARELFRRGGRRWADQKKGV